MTGIYEYWSLPQRLDIKCPDCQHKASFEFANCSILNVNKIHEELNKYQSVQWQTSCYNTHQSLARLKSPNL